MVIIRAMQDKDIKSVINIQSLAYIKDYQESEEVFRDKYAKYPLGCWIAEIDNEPVGYLFSHPYMLDSPPALDAEIDDIPENPDCYFIHDVAVKPEFRGKGIGRLLCIKAKSIAKECNLAQIALVSVQDSHPFWEKMGFKHVIKEAMAKKLRSYKTKEFPEPKFMLLSSQPKAYIH